MYVARSGKARVFIDQEKRLCCGKGNEGSEVMVKFGRTLAWYVMGDMSQWSDT